MILRKLHEYNDCEECKISIYGFGYNEVLFKFNKEGQIFMRGLIFTELFELIEERFGFDVLDDIIVAAKLPNDGAYTATGNYPFDELLSIVIELHNYTELPINTLLEVFGEYLFDRLLESHPQFKSSDNLLSFLENVETYIHIEVKKLYPDAELPKFDIISRTEDTFEFYYISKKELHHLAKGLIQGASNYFKQPLHIEMTPEEGRTYFKLSYK